MTIFKGHGPASPAIVSTSMAARMMTSHSRYGCASSTTRPAVPDPDLTDAEEAGITSAPPSAAHLHASFLAFLLLAPFLHRCAPAVNGAGGRTVTPGDHAISPRRRP